MINWASELAASLLASLGNRWLHVQGVVERARWVGSIFEETDRSYLIAATYLHDIGYAPSLQRTGFHPSMAHIICNLSNKIALFLLLPIIPERNLKHIWFIGLFSKLYHLSLVR